jgi:peptide/nickel transport system substrate-binding protein
MKLGLRLVLSAVVILALMGCKKELESVTTFPREKTLYIAGYQWQEPASFNPLGDRPDWPSAGNVTLMYEPLFAYNGLSGVLEPLLASDYELFDSTLTVTLNSNAHWSDGDAVTNSDVLYTFYLHNKYNTKHHAGWQYINSISINEDSSLVFKLSSKNFNPLVIKDIVSTVEILPEHIFNPLEEKALEKYAELEEPQKSNKVLSELQLFMNDKSVVASGPYTLHSYSPQKIVLSRVENYWGNSELYDNRTAKPKYVIHPIYKGNSSYNLALTQGNIDVSATFCPMVWNKKKDNVGTWFNEEPYYIPGSIPSLIVSQKPTLTKKDVAGNLTKSVLNDAVFRRACASSINSDMIRKIAIQGYAPRLSPGYILNYGIEQLYYSEDDAKEYGVSYDSLAAKEMLKEAGYSWGEDSMLIAPNGKKVAPLKMSSPAGWSDWEAAVKISVQGLRSIGVPVREDFVEEGTYWDKLGMGYFDFIMKTPKSEIVPSLPWSRFEEVMSSKDISDLGVYAYANEGRYQNSEADSLIKIIPTLTNDEELIQAYGELNRLFMRELPVIPLMYRPAQFYQFSTSVWSGYPTDEIAYAPPQGLSVGAGVKALWEIENSKKEVE